MRQLTVSFVGMLIIASAGCYQRASAPILPAVNSDVSAFREEMGMETGARSESIPADPPTGGINEGEGD